ncbi:TetR family transcriptional regulator [Streptomyces diastatochromogenes]|nr:TetR family transcriptional regulator [Streptomyces diastatochromogenes]
MPKVPSSQLVLDAAYRCFCRNGYRRTTISDIVEEARMSRPTVYKYVGSKEEAIVKVVRARLEQAAEAAEAAARDAGTAEEKVLAVLAVKLEVAIRLWRDSHAHAQELLLAATAQAPDLVTAYTDRLAELLLSALTENASQVAPEDTPEVASEDTSQVASDTPEVAPKNTPEGTPEATPKHAPEDTPAVTPEAAPEAAPDNARQAATVLLTFTRGLEDDLRDADAVRRELAAGVRMITRGALGRPAPTLA